MATAPKPYDSTETGEKRSRDELRRDRITAVVTLIIFALLMALLIWLASFGNGTIQDVDYFPMMP